MGEERLQKLLAGLGLGSRREIEEWIRAGRITVNGRLAQLGHRASAADRICIDGQAVDLPRKTTPRRVLAYHKPEGEVCTRADPEGRPTVFAQLPRLHGGRWINVGRLDINTSGLLLLTNDGALAHALMHPSREVEREYAVRVRGAVDEQTLRALSRGVTLEDGPARVRQVRAAGGTGTNRWFHVVVTEGRHRLVRRLWESQGVTVSRLIRVRYGPITLRRGLRAGAWEELVPEQIGELAAAAGIAGAEEAVEPRPGRRKPARRRRRVDARP